MITFSKPQLKKEFYVDGEQVGETPLMHYVATAGLPMKVFVKVLVPVGKHELTVNTPLKSGKFERQFICKSGQQFFAYPRIDLVRAEQPGWLRRWLKHHFTYEGEIVISETPLEPPDGWERLLFYTKKWLGEN